MPEPVFGRHLLDHGLDGPHALGMDVDGRTAHRLRWSLAHLPASER